MNAAEARADEAEDRLRSAVEAREQSKSEHDAHVSMMKAQLGELSRQHGALQTSVHVQTRLTVPGFLSWWQKLNFFMLH